MGTVRNKHVKMLDTLYNRLVKVAKVDDHHDPNDYDEYDEDGNYTPDDYSYAPNDLWMLGQNKDGIIVRAEKVSDMGNGGCEFMAAVDTEDLTEVYLRFAKRGLTVVGYAQTSTIMQRNGGGYTWENEGANFLDTPNLIVMDFCPTPVAIQVNSNPDEDVQTIIVDKISIKTAK